MSAAEERLAGDVNRMIDHLEAVNKVKAAECVVCGRVRKFSRLISLGHRQYRCAEQTQCSWFAGRVG